MYEHAEGLEPSCLRGDSKSASAGGSGKFDTRKPASAGARGFRTGRGGPRWTRTTYLRVISTALCQLS